MTEREQLKSDLNIFLAIIIFLTGVGIIFVYSASSVYAMERFGSAHYFVIRQLWALLLAFIACCACIIVPLSWVQRLSPLAYVGSLGLMVMSLISSYALKIHGAHRWLMIAGVSIQPSALLKIALFVYTATILSRKHNRVKSFAHSYLPIGCVTGIACIFLLKQPDFGSVVTIFATTILLFFVAQFNMRYLLITLLVSIPAASVLIFAKSYRLNRILVFLNPWADAKGKGFQIIQSLIAIGSGHIWGLGVANSRQKFFYLPMQHTDFIFPIIAEEVGFVGSSMIVIAFFLLCVYGMRLASHLTDYFSFFMTVSFVSFITVEAMINFMVTLGLVPTKGLGLPFISYGGTALIVSFCMIGLIINAVRARIGQLRR